MKRIVIDRNIQSLSANYINEMCYKHPSSNGSISLSCKMLNELEGKISAKDCKVIPNTIKKEQVKKLIKYIIDNYQFLLSCHPQQYQNTINHVKRIINTDLSKIKLYFGKNQKVLLLHEEIVRCMRYGYVQRIIFPKYVRQIGIKTCVYCNAQYAITTKKHDSLYQLDHCFPKSKYPYFSANFFNLQPCCASCNIHKSDIEFIYGGFNLSVWVEEGENNHDNLYDFKLSDVSIVKYLCSLNSEELRILITNKPDAPPSLKSLVSDIKKNLLLDSQYQEHKDVAEEILWKYKIYSKGYIESLCSAFSSIFPTLRTEFFRLFMGTYMDPDDVYKRPLAKMIQDISKQLHIDIDTRPKK